MSNIINPTKSTKYFQCHKIFNVFNYLEYRFKSSSKGFWKFYEPCKRHMSYREGDSLFEETAMCRRTFKRYFSRIGTYYPSKQSFKKEWDPFQGKLYASYYHRKDNKTYFFRNHALVESTLKEISQGNLRYQPVDKPVYNSTSQTNNSHSRNDIKRLLPLLFEKRHRKTLITRAREEQPQVPSHDRIAEAPREGEKIFKKMFDLWIATVEKDLDKRERTILTKWRCKELRERYQDTFGGDWEKWKAYCERIEANTFLMGGGPRGWKATLDWALRPENIDKVLKNKYTGQGATRSEKLMQTEREQPVTEDEIQGSELWKQFCVKLALVIGPASFRAWFKDHVTPVNFEKGSLEPTFEVQSNFYRDHISTKFGFQLEDLLPQFLGKKSLKFEVKRK